MLNVNFIEDDAADAVDVASVPVAELSPARRTLGSMIRRRDEANSEIANLTAQLRRLETLKAGEAGPVAALASHDADHAAAVSRWTEGDGSEPAPRPDLEKRETILRLIAEAKATSDAATAAAAGLQSRVNAAAVKAAAATGDITTQAAMVALEEANHLLGEIRQASTTLARLKSDLGASREIVLRSIEALPEAKRLAATPFFARLSAFDSEVRLAMSPTVPATDGGLRWRSLLTRLVHDAGAAVVEA